MKYGLAILASFGIFMVYVLISAALGWRNGGGALPGVIFAMVVLAAWRRIMKMDLNVKKNTVPIFDSTKQDNTSAPGESMPDIEERFYEIAAKEVAEKKFNPGMMAKAFSEADGDEKKSIARYIKYRVEQLSQEYRAEQARQREREKDLEADRHQERLKQESDAENQMTKQVGQDKVEELIITRIFGAVSMFLCVLILTILVHPTRPVEAYRLGSGLAGGMKNPHGIPDEFIKKDGTIDPAYNNYLNTRDAEARGLVGPRDDGFFQEFAQGIRRGFNEIGMSIQYIVGDKNDAREARRRLMLDPQMARPVTDGLTGGTIGHLSGSAIPVSAAIVGSASAAAATGGAVFLPMLAAFVTGMASWFGNDMMDAGLDDSLDTPHEKFVRAITKSSLLAFSCSLCCTVFIRLTRKRSRLSGTRPAPDGPA